MTATRNNISWAIIAFGILFVGWQGWELSNTRKAAEEAEKARAAQQKRLELVIVSAPVALIICGEDQQIVLANPSVETIFGWKKEELVGERITKLIPKELHEKHQKSFSEAVDEMRSKDGNWMMSHHGIRTEGLHKNGTRIPIFISARLIKYNNHIEVISSMRLIKEPNVTISRPLKPDDMIQQKAAN